MTKYINCPVCADGTHLVHPKPYIYTCFSCDNTFERIDDLDEFCVTKGCSNKAKGQLCTTCKFNEISA